MGLPVLGEANDDDVDVAFLLFSRLPLDENRALVRPAQDARLAGCRIGARQEADAARPQEAAR